MVVAVGSGRIGLVDGVEIAVDGMGRLAKVSVDTTKEVVGQETVVGRTVVVIVADEVAGKRVGGEGNVSLVLRLQRLSSSRRAESGFSLRMESMASNSGV